MIRKYVDIYVSHFAPIVNGLFLLIPSAIAIVLYQDFKAMVNVSRERSNLPLPAKGYYDYSEIFLLVLIFGVSTVITARSSKSSKMRNTLILAGLGLVSITPAMVVNHSAIELCILALVAMVSLGSVLVLNQSSLTRRCS
jgi:uncharacterized membrane protein